MDSSGVIPAEVGGALIPDSLGLLPEPTLRLRPFVSSVVLNVSIAVLLLWFTIAQLHKSAVRPRYITTDLVYPIKLRPPPNTLRVKAPPPHPVVELPRKIETQLPQPQPAKPEVAHLETPAMPTMPNVTSPKVVTPVQPKVGSFASEKHPTIATNDRAPAIKTGGFGDPMGVAVNPNASRPATIAAIGKFENAPGTGQRAGSPSVGVVATAGFGSGAGNASKGTGAGGGTIATGGFGGNGTSSSAAPEPRVQQVHFSPPEVLSEPRPQYTQEARQLRIQGEITLQVRFGVDGKVQVLRVVSGLGHGLDQEAALVAEQIRFKPAVKDGQPTDHVTYIHILFQLA
jgi:TonB family protein